MKAEASLTALQNCLGFRLATFRFSVEAQRKAPHNMAILAFELLASKHAVKSAETENSVSATSVADFTQKWKQQMDAVTRGIKDMLSKEHHEANSHD